MSESTTQEGTQGTSRATATLPAGKTSRRGQDSLTTDLGRTTVADTVVAKIAGIAAREVAGFYALGGGTARAVGALRERIPGSRTNHSQGVSVEVGERQAAVDIELIAEYGVAVTDVAAGIRRNVITSVERMTGLDVTEVNIDVRDVHLPGDEADNEDQNRSRVE
ncbi:MAG: Asp23/Gls24 family envelope stress response protein [Actinomycetota bacterium]